MENSRKQIDRKILKTLEPLNRLNPILLDELAAKSIIDEVPADKIICRHGENDSRQIYLLSGQVEVVTAGETKTKIIKTKSALKAPIAQGSPRKVTLKTRAASTLLYIDADLLELLMSDEPELNSSLNTSYEVAEIGVDDNDDWMLAFLQSPAFLHLPTTNIQKLLTHMEEVPVKKDQVVINQGDKNDNYYIVKSGSCNVHRKPFKDSANVLLATLPTGSGFGEEALISNGTRNATITMRENGILMRLKKDDFLTLLIKPLISYIEASEIPNKLNGGCVIIDVRSEQESKQKPLANSVNIPLSMLRIKFDSLNADRDYLIVCNDGSQSAAAAFLMIQSSLNCSVLKGGLDNAKNQSKKSSDAKVKEQAAVTAAAKEAALAKEQATQIAEQQEQIKKAREKAEQDIIKHKKELAESRARISQKNQPSPSLQAEAAKLKEKASQELAKAQAESKAIELCQKETEETMLRAEKMMEESTSAIELARKQAEKEAALIKQRAIEEAKYLRTEVEAARQKLEQDAKRIKEEEKIIKQSALKIKNEADEIRRKALSDAEQVRTEIEATRALLNKKLQKVQLEEKQQRDAIITEAKKQASKLASTKTKQAEAEAIRQKAKQDAIRLHKELKETRKQIEAEAAYVINKLKEQSKKAVPENNIHVIEEEVLVEIVAQEPSPATISTESIDYKSVSIPGMSAIEPMGLDEAKRKAEAIKGKLTESQGNNVKTHKSNNRTILEGEEDLFIFKEPEVAEEKIAVAQRTRAEDALTQIPTEQKSFVIHPQQEQKTAFKNNQFLNQTEAPVSVTSYASQSNNKEPNFVVSKNVQQFNKQAYIDKHHRPKSNTFAIAASFLMILAGAVFTLHATNTLKVQSIAALFNSGNDTVQTTAIASAKTKTIRKKILRADTKVNVKKKVGNKMDNIMQGWKNILSESENPKKKLNK